MKGNDRIEYPIKCVGVLIGDIIRNPIGKFYILAKIMKTYRVWEHTFICYESFVCFRGITSFVILFLLFFWEMKFLENVFFI